MIYQSIFILQYMGDFKKFVIIESIVIITISIPIGTAVLILYTAENELKNPSLTVEEIKSRSLKDISVQEMINNIDQYQDKIVHLNGTIHSSSPYYGDVYILTVDTGNQENNFENIIHLKYASEIEPIIQKNIDFYGTVTGITQDKSLIGTSLYGVEMDSLIVTITDLND